LDKVFSWTGRHWRWLTVVAWALFCAWFVYNRWAGIYVFALGDTDDNLRMSQVRALLNGQDWYDLRQHRLAGSNIHWSRLVDLPLAALILLFRPLVGGADAERIAVAIAPMLPFLLMLFGLALTIRRLIHRDAFLLGFAALFFAGLTIGMFMPLRIDHHGWQLALLAVAIAGIADPRPARGGATLGIATALSLAIGLELLIYLALLGSSVVVFWLIDRDERRRLSAYAATLAGGTALSFLLFASYANREAVCDALSPVWLSDALLGGALLFVLALLSPADWKRRLLLAAGAGAAVAAFHALAWPQCLSRLEGVSPEVHDLWLSHVREARPVYRHGTQAAALISALPITGAIGWILLIIANRADPALMRRTIAAALPAWIAGMLLLWQTRTGPGAQMLSIPGAVAIVWTLLPAIMASRMPVVRVLGSVALVIVGLGAAVPLVIDRVAPTKSTPRDRAIGKANRQCNSLAGYRPIAKQPKGVVFTFVDYGPRLITITHHNGITGPYHRNGEQIADVMKTFRGSPEQARQILAKYRAHYLLICPNSSTTTIFMAEARNGFYAQLHKGKVPPWLQPVPLPADSPFRMWRVLR
jgi:hypothetical protein